MDRTKGLVGGPDKSATFAQYLRLLKDRPPKFDEAQAGYRAAARGPACQTCRHFYVSKTARRSVCEVVRPQYDENISPTFTCRFHTIDGISYPLLSEDEKA